MDDFLTLHAKEIRISISTEADADESYFFSVNKAGAGMYFGLTKPELLELRDMINTMFEEVAA